MENTIGNGLRTILDENNRKRTNDNSKKLDNESYVCVHSEDDSCEAWAMDVAHTVLRPWTLMEWYD